MLHNLGFGHTTISLTWTAICFTICSITYKNWLQTTSFIIFIAIFSILITKHNWHHNRHNHGRRWWKLPPSAPHEALHSAPTLQMDSVQPPELADVILGGVEGVYGLQSAPLFGRWWIATTSCVLRAIHIFFTAPNIIATCSVCCCLSIGCAGAERKASCGALGGHFRRQHPWLAMVVSVDVGHWRLTSDQFTVGIIEIFYGIIFFIPT